MRFVEGPSVVRFTTPSTPRVGCIIEGRCPTCQGALERRKADGWCTSCEVGWSLQSQDGEGTVSLTIEPRIPPILHPNKETP